VGTVQGGHGKKKKNMKYATGQKNMFVQRKKSEVWTGGQNKTRRDVTQERMKFFLGRGDLQKPAHGERRGGGKSIVCGGGGKN